MRKFYLLLAILSMVLLANAQTNVLPPNLQPLNQPYQFNTKSVNNKTVSCIDTIRYPQSKTTTLLYDTMDYFTYIGAVAQAYHFSGTGLVHGISAYMLLDLDGIQGNTAPISMVIKVTNIDGGNVPTTVIASDTVQVADVGYMEQPLMFTNPVPVSDSFAVTIEIDTMNPSNPYYITNNYNDGNAEELSSLAYSGVWYNLYPTWSGTWDVDMILSPIFEQNLSAQYVLDTNSVCLGNSVTFTNTTQANVDSMFFTSPFSNNLDLGDFITNVQFDSSYTYTYSNSGSFGPMYEIIWYGYSGNCVDDSLLSVEVLDTATAYFGWSDVGGGTYQFSDSSLFASTYLWDFGDGNVNTVPNPSHTYATPGNYIVCLTVTDANGCNSNTICDTVSFTVGINDFDAPNHVSIYPIPASKYFNVNVPSNYYHGDIIITDIVGEKIKVVPIEKQDKVKILTKDFNSGVYFMSIDYGGERVFTKRIIIDK